ncbi:MAG: TetR/AcrR family transcriptional regulator [Bacteroidota bacterium]
MSTQGKEKIIEASFYLFLKNGYKGVTLKDIRQLTGLSQGAIYHHFESKRAIYLAVVKTYFFSLLQNDFTGESLHFKEQVRKGFERFTNIIDTIEKLKPEGICYPIRSFFQFQLESEQDGHFSDKATVAVEHYRAEITQLTQGAIDRKEISTPLTAVVIAQQLMILIEGLAIHHSLMEKNCKEFLLQKYDEVISPFVDSLASKKGELITGNR